MLPTLEEVGIGLVCFAPLGRGLLSGQVRSADDFAPDDFRRLPRYQGENFRKNLRLVDKVHEPAAASGATAAQLALAWILSRGDNMFRFRGWRSVRGLRRTSRLPTSSSPRRSSPDEAIMPNGGLGDRYGDYKLQSVESVS